MDIYNILKKLDAVEKKTLNENTQVDAEQKIDEAWPGTPEYEKKFGKPEASSAFDKKKISTGTVYSRKYQDEPESDDDTPKKAGRPTGSKRSLGAKLPSGKQSKIHSKGAIAENAVTLAEGQLKNWLHQQAEQMEREEFIAKFQDLLPEAGEFWDACCGDLDEASYSAKAARAGKDIGKPGKNFAKIAKGAAERYGSKERGEKVAGAVLNKLRHPSESIEEDDALTRQNREYHRMLDKGISADQTRKKADADIGNTKKVRAALDAYDDYGTAASKYDRKYNKKDVEEVAPPGAKAERMVKHIKKSLSKDGHLSDKDKAIAYATTWKAHNQGKVEEEGAQPNPKEDQWTAQALAQHKRKLAQDANRRKMAPKPMEETMGGTVAGAVAPAPGAKTFAEASSESHTTEWKAAGKAVHAILKKCGYKGIKTEKGYMWTKETPKGTAFVDIDFDERDPEVVAWGEGELKGAKDKSYWQSGSGNINEIADKIAELFANVKPGEAPKEMDEADKDGKKPDADKDGVPDWADKKPGKDDNEESDDKDDSDESDDGDEALKKMKKHAGVDKDDDKEESKDDESDEKDDESDDKEESKDDETDDKDDDKEEKSESKDKSGTPYGQSVYESAFKKQLKQQLTESISMNTSEDDGGHKSVTVTATDEDADKLSEMLKMAGLFSSGGYEEVVVGADHVDEDLANAPDETYSDMDTILNKLSGGLNGPKTTGQTTTGNIVNRDIKRQGPSVKTVAEEVKEAAEAKLWNMYKKYDNK